MKKLFIIDGASGPAKHALVSLIREVYESTSTSDVCLIRKYSTRGYKKDENELIQDIYKKAVDKSEIERHVKSGEWYKYEYKNEIYGIDKADLENKLSSFDNVFLIVRSKVLIKSLREIYEQSSMLGFRVNVVPVFLYSDKKDVENELKETDASISEQEINDRFKRLKLTYDDYINDIDNVYEDIIIYCGDKSQFKNIIANLIKKYADDNSDYDEVCVSKKERYRLPGTIPLRARDAIRQHLQNFEKNVFIMIKYADDQESTILSIKEILHENGYNGILAKDLALTEDTYNTIAVSYCCKYGIAVFEGRRQGKKSFKSYYYDYNPNVAYELSIMHLLSKKCLILLHKSYENEQKFFDITHTVHSTYGNSVDIRDAVKRWITNLQK